MLPASDPLVLVLPRYAKGGQPDPRNVAIPLTVALTRKWTFDAHVVQYAPSDSPVRWNDEHVAEHPYHIGLAFFDFDAHDLPPEQIQPWSEAALAKLPPGFQGYRTAGGFRALTLLAEPHIVCDAESWSAWHAFSAGLGAALSAVFGVQADKACTDPGRIFRLPNVKREGGKPCFPELYGTLGVGTLAPLPVEPRPALQRPNDPEALGGNTLLGALFAAAGLVQGEQGAKLVVTCPWAAEHNGGDTSGTVVMPDPDGLGLGKFHCAHGNTCGKGKERFTWAAVAELLKLAAVQTEARHWPEPSLLGTYARVSESGAMPDWAVTRGAPEPEPEPAATTEPMLALEMAEAQVHAVTYRLEHPGPGDDIPTLVSRRRTLRAQLAEIQAELRTRPVGRSLTEIRKAIGGDWETPETISYTPRAWVCRRLAIAAGRPVSVSAYGGLFKTWLIEALAVSVASGVSVFGDEVPFERTGAVLYVTREQDLTECRGRLTALCNGVSVSYRELVPTRLHVVSFPDLDFSATKAISFGAALREWALATSAALVVVDSQIAMAPGTDQNTDAAAISLRVLQESLTPLQCASVILMHENKGSQTVDLTGKGNLALKGSASLNNATSVGIRLQALTETDVTTLDALAAQSIYAEFTRCQIGAQPKPFILRPDMSGMNDADTEHQVALLAAVPLPEGQVFRKGRLVSDAADPEGALEPLTEQVLEREVISYLLGVGVTTPTRSYSATALRNNLVHMLRRERFDVPAKDKDARALIEALLASLELRVLHRDGTGSESFVQGRLRRKGTGFWFEVTESEPPTDRAELIEPFEYPEPQNEAERALLAELRATLHGILAVPECAVSSRQVTASRRPIRAAALRLWGGPLPVVRGIPVLVDPSWLPPGDVAKLRAALFAWYSTLSSEAPS